ncbi:hypothetical protein ACI0X9_003312 [Cronobacter turicensis]
MRRTFFDKSAAMFSLTDKYADKSYWSDTTPNGDGLPSIPGVYRFRVPIENDISEKIEFLSLLRWRRVGARNILFPTFEYFTDENVATIPEGTQWAYREQNDPQLLSPDSFPIVQQIADKTLPCPFCSKIPTLAGTRRCMTTLERYATPLPYQFNQFWFTCCEWIAPAPRSTINGLINDWNRAIIEKK